MAGKGKNKQRRDRNPEPPNSRKGNRAPPGAPTFYVSKEDRPTGRTDQGAPKKGQDGRQRHR